MALETSLVPIGTIISEHLKDKVGADVIPLGGIVFAEGQKAMLLGEGLDGRLVAQEIRTPEGFSPASLVQGRHRITLLPHLQLLTLGQVNLSPGDMRVNRSILGKPSLTLALHYDDIVNGQKSALILDEEQVLRFLIGEKGGIAVFRGSGLVAGAALVEENALVLEPTEGKSNYGVVLFMHPQASNYIDSVLGVEQFFRDLNKQFENMASLPLQTEALRALDFSLKHGLISLDLAVREEIFRAQVIANARLAEGVNGAKYRDFLNTYLEMNSRFRAIGCVFRRFGRKYVEQEISDLANKSVDGFIIGNCSQDGHSVLDRENEELIIYDRLYTEWASEARKSVEEFFGDNRAEMFQYIKRIAEIAMVARTEEDASDILTLLKEVDRWPHHSHYWPYNITEKSGSENFMVNFYANPSRGEEINHLQKLIDRVESHLQVRRERMLLSKK